MHEGDAVINFPAPVLARKEVVVGFELGEVVVAEGEICHRGLVQVGVDVSGFRSGPESEEAAGQE